MPEYTVQVGDLFEVTVNAKNPQEANEIAQMQVHALETLDNTKANKRLAGEPGTNPNFAPNMLNAVKGADKYAQLTGTNDAWRSIGFKDRNDFLNIQGDYDTILRSKGFKTISDTINEGLSEDEAAWKASVRKKQPDAVFSRDTKGNLIATSPTNVAMSADKRNVNRMAVPANANTKGKKRFDQRKKELQQYAQIDVSNTPFSPMAMNIIRSFVDGRVIGGPLPSSMAIQMTNELKTKHPDWNDQELMKAIKFYIANKSKSRIAAPASSEGTRLADHFNKIDLEIDSQSSTFLTRLLYVSTATVSSELGTLLGTEGFFPREACFDFNSSICALIASISGRAVFTASDTTGVSTVFVGAGMGLSDGI